MSYLLHVFHWFIHSHIHHCFVVLERPEDLNNKLFFKNKTKTSATGKEMILVPLWYGYVVSGFGWYYNYLSSSPKSSCIKRLLKLWHKFVTESKFFFILYIIWVFIWIFQESPYFILPRNFGQEKDSTKEVGIIIQ